MERERETAPNRKAFCFLPLPLSLYSLSLSSPPLQDKRFYTYSAKGDNQAKWKSFLLDLSLSVSKQLSPTLSFHPLSVSIHPLSISLIPPSLSFHMQRLSSLLFPPATLRVP